MQIMPRALLLIALLALSFSFGNVVLAQDVYVHWIQVTPDTNVKAGTTVTVKARIGNAGYGWAMAQDLDWRLSTSPEIDREDYDLNQGNDPDIIPDILYDGSEITVTRQFILPPWTQKEAYLGVIVDSFELNFDPDRSNNIAYVKITYKNTNGNDDDDANDDASNNNNNHHEFFDPVGDYAVTDIFHVQTEVTATSLEVTATFQQSLPYIFHVLLALDLDQNPETSLPTHNTVPGADATVMYTHVEYTPDEYILTTKSGQRSHTSVAVDGTVLTFTIPLSSLDSDGAMDLVLMAGGNYGPDFDRAPDIGVFDTAMGNVVVRRKSTQDVNVTLGDPKKPGEPSFPDMTRFRAETVGDQLHMTITYAHSLDRMAEGLSSSGMWVYISNDADKRLCTGFDHTRRLEHPSLGVDYQFILYLDGISTPYAELKQDKNGDGFADANDGDVITFGLPFNDLFMGVSGNEIVVHVPLSYLDNLDGVGGWTVSTHDTANLLDYQLTDWIPNTGAWDLVENKEIPSETCQTEIKQFADSVYDSIGNGLDNDELIELRSCVGKQSLLLTLRYADYYIEPCYKLSKCNKKKYGATSLHFDMDQNVTTGKIHQNIQGNSQLGEEFNVLTYYHLYSLQQVTWLEMVEPDSHLLYKSQFTQVNLNKDEIYLSVPLDCIPSGSALGVDDFNLMVQTHVEGPLQRYDDLPNSGVLTLPTRAVSTATNNDTTLTLHLTVPPNSFHIIPPSLRGTNDP